MPQPLKSTKALDLELCDIANRQPMTPGQRRVFGAIIKLTEEQGLPPTIKELGAELGLSSPNAVFEHIGKLKAKGYLEGIHHRSRGVVVKR